MAPKKLRPGETYIVKINQETFKQGLYVGRGSRKGDYKVLVKNGYGESALYKFQDFSLSCGELSISSPNLVDLSEAERNVANNLLNRRNS